MWWFLQVRLYLDGREVWCGAHYRKGERMGRSHIKGICVRTTGFVWWVESKEGRKCMWAEGRPRWWRVLCAGCVQEPWICSGTASPLGTTMSPCPLPKPWLPRSPRTYATSRPNVKPTLPTNTNSYSNRLLLNHIYSAASVDARLQALNILA